MRFYLLSAFVLLLFTAAGQVSPASLLTEQAGKDRQELHFVLPALKAGAHLDLKALVSYRLWLQEGQMTPDEIAAKDRAFIEPVAVKLR